MEKQSNTVPRGVVYGLREDWMPEGWKQKESLQCWKVLIYFFLSSYLLLDSLNPSPLKWRENKWSSAWFICKAKALSLQETSLSGQQHRGSEKS